MSSYRELDKQYDDYIERREKEGFMKRPASKKEEKRPPSGRFQPKSATKKLTPEETKKQGGYEMPNTTYQPSGYKQTQSELGSDPLTTVRTMRNNLRNRALKYRDMDKPVKSHLCDSASNQLTIAEGDLLKMNEKRSNAILVGDTKEAEKIKKDMEEYKDRAVRNTYADLVMDDDEMRAFGVDSMWTPDIAPQGGRTLGPRRPPSQGRFVARVEGSPKRRESVQKRETSAKQRTRTPDANYAPNFTKTEKPTEWDPYIRRNGRLANMPKTTDAAARSMVDDPYQPKRTFGTCEYCGETGSLMGSRGGMEEHYKRECTVMNKCRYCQKLIPVSKLTDHYLNRCSFLGDRMTSCKKCGLAMDKIDQENGVVHPLCRDGPPPPGAQWCPLCSVAVDDTQESWQDHLKNTCYNNTRREGPDPATPPLNNGNSSNGPGYGGSGGGQGGKGGSVSLKGRMIDADKLVVALQQVQMKKKKKKQEQLEAAEAKRAEEEKEAEKEEKEAETTKTTKK